MVSTTSSIRAWRSGADMLLEVDDLAINLPTPRGSVALVHDVSFSLERGDAGGRADAYPHQLSGGEGQRAMIAMALACGPDLLIADEPTTALDVTLQREILDLVADLVAASSMALLLISHDLGVMAENTRRLLVMYGGTVVESGPTADVLARLAHPYTRGLFAGRPRLGAHQARLAAIAGQVPAPG